MGDGYKGKDEPSVARGLHIDVPMESGGTRYVSPADTAGPFYNLDQAKRALRALEFQRHSPKITDKPRGDAAREIDRRIVACHDAIRIFEQSDRRDSEGERVRLGREAEDKAGRSNDQRMQQLQAELVEVYVGIKRLRDEHGANQPTDVKKQLRDLFTRETDLRERIKQRTDLISQKKYLGM